MALRIANNIAAMNTQRWLAISDTGMKKSLERLSSGFRINKAADDAAGLAISQSFRANIASFKVASRNASEASALLQVAEGGMDQIGNMLTRLKELATQASSANAGTSEREKIEAESQQLITEIDRIAASTKYGSTALLSGAFGGLSGATSAAAETTLSTDQDLIYKYTDDSGDTDAMTIEVAADAITKEGTWALATAGGAVMELTNGSITATATGVAGVFDFSEVGITLTATANTQTTAMAADSLTIANLGIDTSAFTIGSDAVADTYTITATDGGIALAGAGDGGTQSFTGLSDGAQTLDFSSLGITLSLDSDYDTSEMNLDGMTVVVSASNAQTFQIGSENTSENQISIALDGVSTTTLGINGLDLETTAGAQAALTLIDTAIGTLGGSRGDIGAYMNRLSYASANLSTTIENTQAAESVIRDVDMASEMTDFTKNQILLQAGTAMLAQANMAPQQVLSLFG